MNTHHHALTSKTSQKNLANRAFAVKTSGKSINSSSFTMKNVSAPSRVILAQDNKTQDDHV